jgi:hypothetical protein
MDDQLVQGIYFQKGLPMEIIHIILVYLRQPQSAILLKDIHNFSSTMPIITNKYYRKWIIEWQSKEGEDINWLENDLILYANEYAPTLVGMQPKFKEILGRFGNVKKASQYIFNNYAYSNNLTAKTRANILWCLFTPAERDEFIQSCYQ